MTAFHSPIPDDHLAELDALASASLNGEMSDQEIARLEEIVCEDAELRRLYVRYMFVAWNLRIWARYPLSGIAGQQLPTLSQEATALPFECLTDSDSNSLRNPPSLGFLTTAYHGTVGFFSQEVPFGILMATLFMAMGGLIGSVMTVEHYTQMPGQSQSSAERSFVAANAMDKAISAAKENDVQWVGRITGMVDCKWSDDDKDFMPAMGYAAVPLGRKYKLDSGLMEITYDTGAKVILQGPVTYEVESVNGGYMSVGKLTGKVEVEKAKGFFVRTPTAVVTDLGTEYGVEVDSQESRVEVFQGKVVISLATPGTVAASGILLTAGKSARINPKGVTTRSSVHQASDLPTSIGFVRTMPKLQIVSTVNPSFEQPTLAIGEIHYFDATTKSGWTKAGDGVAGIQQNHGTMPWEPDGRQMAFIDWSNNSCMLCQTLDAHVGDYSTLLLTVYTGLRLDEDGEPDVEMAVQLYAAESGKLLGEARQRTSQKGLWYRMQLRCNPPADVPRDDHLKIVLRRTDGQNQVQFDDVRLIGLPRPNKEKERR